MSAPSAGLRVAIVGCGPAGLSAALFLHRQAHDVTLFERFNAPRPLGSGLILQPTGLDVLRELGLLREINELGARIERMLGISMPSAKTALDVSYAALGPDAHGLAVHRAALFDVLYACVRHAAIAVRTSIEVCSMMLRGQHAWLVDADENELGPFDLIVDASGANSKLHRFAQNAVPCRTLKYGAIWGAFDWPGSPFDANTLEQRYVGAHTMIGVLPIGRHAGIDNDQAAFFWSVRTREYELWLDRGLDVWKKRVLSIWPETEPILDQITNPSQMVLARYGHYTMRQPTGPKLAFVGDSAHATSPQLGQGANMALLDAWALSKALDEGSDIETALRRYAEIRRWHVRLFQFASLTLTGFYQSDSRTLAWLRDTFFDPVSRLPIAKRIVALLISGLLADPRKLAIRSSTQADPETD